MLLWSTCRGGHTHTGAVSISTDPKLVLSHVLSNSRIKCQILLYLSDQVQEELSRVIRKPSGAGGGQEEPVYLSVRKSVRPS